MQFKLTNPNSGRRTNDARFQLLYYELKQMEEQLNTFHLIDRQQRGSNKTTCSYVGLMDVSTLDNRTLDVSKPSYMFNVGTLPRPSVRNIDAIPMRRYTFVMSTMQVNLSHAHDQHTTFLNVGYLRDGLVHLIRHLSESLTQIRKEANKKSLDLLKLENAFMGTPVTKSRRTKK